MPHFTVHDLKHDQLLEAWPIIRMSAEHPNSRWWLDDADRLIDRGGGVLAARAPDNSVHGVAVYRPVDHRFRGRVLAVEALATFELSRKAPARRALCDALDDLSEALDCRGIAFGEPADLPSADLS